MYRVTAIEHVSEVTETFFIVANSPDEVLDELETRMITGEWSYLVEPWITQ